MGQWFKPQRVVRGGHGANRQAQEKLQTGFPNGTVKEYETYEEAWDFVTDMVLNDDLVWVDFYPTEHNWDMVRVRKGSNHGSEQA